MLCILYLYNVVRVRVFGRMLFYLLKGSDLRSDTSIPMCLKVADMFYLIITKIKQLTNLNECLLFAVILSLTYVSAG